VNSSWGYINVSIRKAIGFSQAGKTFLTEVLYKKNFIRWSNQVEKKIILTAGQLA